MEDQVAIVDSAVPPRAACRNILSTEGFGTVCWLDAADYAVRYRAPQPDPALKLVTASHGVGRIAQAGWDAPVEPGRVLCVDARRPFELRSTGAALFHVRLPLHVLTQRHPDLDVAALGGTLSASPEGHVLSSMMMTLAQEGTRFGEASMHSALRGLLEWMGTFPRRTPASIVEQRVMRARRTIETRLQQPGLDPVAVAAAVGVSRRHLDSAFMATLGISVAGYLREQRLSGAAAELRGASPGTNAEVAYRWGFADASHFARRFRARFGCSPSDYARRFLDS